MRLGEQIKSTMGKIGIPPELTDRSKLANIDLLLSGDSESALSDLISRGIFMNKTDFVSFIVREYFQNNLGSMLSGDKLPPESFVMDIINKSGIGESFSDSDIKNALVPLLVTSFYAIYRYMTKKEALKPA